MKAFARAVGLRRHRFTRFRWADYLALHPDLVAAGITTRGDALRHYRTSGKGEGRRWYISMPTRLLRTVPRHTPDTATWSSAPAPVGTPRTSVDAALRRLDTEHLLIAASLEHRERVPSASDLDRWTADLDAGARSHLSLYADIAYIDPCAQRPPHGDGPTTDERPIFSMGSVTMTTTEWRRRRDNASGADAAMVPSWSLRSTERAGVPTPLPRPTVSVLCSLYRSDAHLDRFLGNIIEQTAFAETEFIVVATDPSPTELAVLEEAASAFPNIRLEVVTPHIGIYEAWNRAAGAARGQYLTNMNADDLRRRDSIERQREILDAAPWIDVVFQDVLVSLDPNTPWPVLAAINARSTLPPATAAVLMSYVNSPHNAPMWRRSLHDRIGWFDETYTSAGDSEFWIRAARAGAAFYKCDDPHVSYFLNPDGLSTAHDGVVGAHEHRQVLAAHADLLPLGPPPLPVAPLRVNEPVMARADRVTRAYLDTLRTFAPRHPAAVAPHSGRRHIVLDDQGLTLGAPGAGDAWIAALTHWTPALLAERDIEVTILNRSGVLAGTGHRVVPFATRPWNSPYPAADRDVIDRVCEALSADLFITTANTFPTNTPAVTIDLCPTSWLPAQPPTIRERLECEVASIVAPNVELDEFQLAPWADRRGTEFQSMVTALHASQLRMQR